jgi:hypothetical protein
VRERVDGRVVVEVRLRVAVLHPRLQISATYEHTARRAVGIAWCI